MAPKQNSVTRPTGCAVQISKEDIILYTKGFSARKNVSIRLMDEFLTYILTLNELGGLVELNAGKYTLIHQTM